MAGKSEATGIQTVGEAFATVEAACARAVEIAESAKVPEDKAGIVRAGVKNVRGLVADAKGRFQLLATGLGESV